jgi:hypothetical protein
LPDPFLAVAEVLILLLAPAMVVLMAAVHACAPAHLRMFGLIAFGWMLVAAGLTMTVHVVELVVGPPTSSRGGESGSSATSWSSP